MNRLEIEVNKRKLVCSFGLGFLGECLENLDLSVTDIGGKLDKNPFKWIPILMFESVKYSNGGKLDFTKNELVEWLDNDGVKGDATMNSFLLAFIESLTKNVPKDDSPKTTESEPKKK